MTVSPPATPATSRKLAKSHRAVRSGVWPELWTLLPLLLVVLVAGEWAARSGAGHASLLRLGGALLITQLAPGALIWRALRPSAGWLVEDLVFGAATGAALAVVASVLSVITPFGAVMDWTFAWMVAGTLFAVPATRKRIRLAHWQPLPWWWGVGAAAAACGLLVLSGRYFAQTMPGQARLTTQYHDVPFHLALVGEVQHRMPPHTPQVASESLDYHWFAHAWMAQLGSTSGADLDVILLRFAPLFCAAAIAVGFALVGTRLTRTALAGPLVGAVLLLVGPVAIRGTWGLSYPAFPASPSTNFCLVLSAPLAVVLAARWRGEVPHWTWPAVALLAATAGGSKGSLLPVLLVGVLFATAAAWAGRHRHRRRVAIDAGIVTLVTVVMIKVLFGGRAGTMTVTPFDSMVHTGGSVFADEPVDGWGVGAIMSLTVLMLAVLLLSHVAAFAAVRSSAVARDPSFWLLIGMIAAGVGALLVFEHPGEAQLYFLRVALGYYAVALVWGLTVLLSRHRGVFEVGVGVAAGVLVLGPMRAWLPGDGTREIGAGFLQILSVVVVLAVVGLFVALVRRRDRVTCPRSSAALTVATVLLAGLVGAGIPGAVETLSNARVIQRIVHGTPIPTIAVNNRVNGAVRVGEVRAAQYIAQHAEPDDLVMTNRHCANLRMRLCNARRFWLAAYSERRVLIEGWAYTYKNNTGGGGDPDRGAHFAPFWDRELLQLNDGLYTEPTAAAARDLYQRGVRWVYVDKRLSHSEALDSIGKRVFDNRVASVYKLEAAN